MARWVWWIFILKIIELSDTVIFILRKKYNQVSFLHVYHHSMTVVMVWITCKYVPGMYWVKIVEKYSILYIHRIYILYSILYTIYTILFYIFYIKILHIDLCAC